VFKITLNRELSTKPIQKNSFPSTAHESQFSDKQKFHSAPKQRSPVSTKVLSNWPFILWLQGPASSAWRFTFLSRELSISWYEIMHLPVLGNLPTLGDFPLSMATPRIKYAVIITIVTVMIFRVKKTTISERCMVKMYLHIKPEFNIKLKTKIYHSPFFCSFLL